MSSFAPPARAKDGGIEAPMSLGGLFADSSDSDEEGAPFDQQYSEQTVHLAEESLTIRQYCWHMANANKGGRQCLVAVLPVCLCGLRQRNIVLIIL